MTAPSPFRLDDRRALVTGGGRGIGRACALALAAAGAEVLVTSRTAVQLDAVVGEIEARGGRAVALPADLETPAGCEALLADLGGRHPEGIDILLNNAAISPYVAPAEEMDDEAWAHILRVNVEATVRLTRSVAQPMLRRGAGAIINVTSIAATHAVPRLSAYSASKGALAAWTRSLAVEWAPRGVRVNAVAPAYIDTDMTAEVKKRDKLRAAVEARTPMGRFGRPEEVAGAVVFLASDAASYITGSTLHVDGGWTAC